MSQPTRSVWKDITTDPRTGHTVAKDLFKAQAFYAGLFYLLLLVPATKLWLHEDLTTAPGVLLLGLAFGVQALKEGSNYLNRKTADDSGNPLMQAGTEQAPATPNLPLGPQP